MADTQAKGILLDAEGHYVMLGVAKYPDTRPYLFEISLVRLSAGVDLEQAERDTWPRVVVSFLVLGDACCPVLLDLLRQGLRHAGAREISLQ